MASDDGVSDELERIWMEAVMAYTRICLEGLTSAIKT
jgi:hypothetical protein